MEDVCVGILHEIRTKFERTGNTFSLHGVWAVVVFGS